MAWVNRNLLKLTGIKSKFVQIAGGKSKIPQIIWGKIFHEGQKPKNLQNTRTESKKKNYKEKKPEMTYITRGKTLLTL
jgi:hypothetical protein